MHPTYTPYATPLYAAVKGLAISRAQLPLSASGYANLTIEYYTLFKQIFKGYFA